MKKNKIGIVMIMVLITGCLHENTSLEDLSSAPKAASSSIKTNEDTPILVELSLTDRENDTLELFIEENPTHGVLEGVYPNLTYSPNQDYFGNDQFKYKVSDGQYDSNIATVSIAIDPINDLPIISGTPSQSVKGFEEFHFSPLISDVDGDALTFSINVLPSWATFDSVSGTLQGIPTNNDSSLLENLIISVSDGTETVELPAFSINILVNSWTPKTPLSTGRYGASASLIDTKFYITGGFGESGHLASMEVYNAIDNTWQAAAPMSEARYDHTSNVVSGKLYVIGGETGSLISSLEEYDISNDTWTVKNPMPTSRSRHASCSANNKIYVFGGFVSISHDTQSEIVEEYNPATDSWQIKQPMSDKRAGMICETINEKIYLFGGHDNGTLVEIYDPALDTWTTGAPIATGVEFGAAISSVNEKIYIFGGYSTRSGGIYLNNLVQEYDSLNNTWVSKSSILLEKYQPAAASYNNIIYLFGGKKSDIFTIVEAYDPNLDF